MFLGKADIYNIFVKLIVFTEGPRYLENMIAISIF